MEQFGDPKEAQDLVNSFRGEPLPNNQSVGQVRANATKESLRNQNYRTAFDVTRNKTLSSAAVDVWGDLQKSFEGVKNIGRIANEVGDNRNLNALYFKFITNRSNFTRGDARNLKRLRGIASQMPDNGLEFTVPNAYNLTAASGINMFYGLLDEKAFAALGAGAGAGIGAAAGALGFGAGIVPGTIAGLYVGAFSTPIIVDTYKQITGEAFGTLTRLMPGENTKAKRDEMVNLAHGIGVLSAGLVMLPIGAVVKKFPWLKNFVSGKGISRYVLSNPKGRQFINKIGTVAASEGIEEAGQTFVQIMGNILGGTWDGTETSFYQAFEEGLKQKFDIAEQSLRAGGFGVIGGTAFSLGLTGVEQTVGAGVKRLRTPKEPKVKKPEGKVEVIVAKDDKPVEVVEADGKKKAETKIFTRKTAEKDHNQYLKVFKNTSEMQDSMQGLIEIEKAFMKSPQGKDINPETFNLLKKQVERVSGLINGDKVYLRREDLNVIAQEDPLAYNELLKRDVNVFNDFGDMTLSVSDAVQFSANTLDITGHLRIKPEYPSVDQAVKTIEGAQKAREETGFPVMLKMDRFDSDENAKFLSENPGWNRVLPRAEIEAVESKFQVDYNKIKISKDYRSAADKALKIALPGLEGEVDTEVNLTVESHRKKLDSDVELEVLNSKIEELDPDMFKYMGQKHTGEEKAKSILRASWAQQSLAKFNDDAKVVKRLRKKISEGKDIGAAKEFPLLMDGVNILTGLYEVARLKLDTGRTMDVDVDALVERYDKFVNFMKSRRVGDYGHRFNGDRIRQILNDPLVRDWDKLGNLIRKVERDAEQIRFVRAGVRKSDDKFQTEALENVEEREGQLVTEIGKQALEVAKKHEDYDPNRTRSESIELTAREKVHERLRAAYGGITNMRFLLNRADQEVENGWWFNQIIARLEGIGQFSGRHGLTALTKARKEFMGELDKLIDNYGMKEFKTLAKVGNVSQETLNKVKNIPALTRGKLTKNNLMVLLLNMGTESNKKAATNFEIRETDAEGNVTLTRKITRDEIWDILKGELTEKDFDFAQGIWDLNDKFKDRVVESYRLTEGKDLDLIEATEFTVKFNGREKKYKGGYFALSYDRELTTEQQLKELQDSLDANFMESYSGMVFSPHTIQRVGSNFNLDLTDFTQGFDRMLYDMTMRVPVKEATNILANKDAEAALVSVIGHDGYKQVIETVQKLTNTHGTSTDILFKKQQKFIMKLVQRAETAVVYNFLVGSASTLVVNTSSLAEVVSRQGFKNSWKYMRPVIMRMLADKKFGGSYFEAAAEVDPSLLDYMEGIDEHVINKFEKFVPRKHKYGGYKKYADAHDALNNILLTRILGGIDARIKTVGIIAAREQFLNGDGDKTLAELHKMTRQERELAADSFANSLVGGTTMRASAIDKAPIQHGEFSGRLVRFWNEARSVLNNRIRQARRARSGAKRAKEKFGEGDINGALSEVLGVGAIGANHVMLMGALTGIFIASQYASGRDPFEEDEDAWDVMGTVVSNYVKTLLFPVPIVREMVFTAETGQPISIPALGAGTDVVVAGKGLGQFLGTLTTEMDMIEATEGLSEFEIKAFFRTIGVVTGRGVPVHAFFKYKKIMENIGLISDAEKVRNFKSRVFAFKDANKDVDPESDLGQYIARLDILVDRINAGDSPEELQNFWFQVGEEGG